VYDEIRGNIAIPHYNYHHSSMACITISYKFMKHKNGNSNSHGCKIMKRS